MGAMFKALGLTIWGLIVFGLLIVFFFVGYQAALKYHTSSAFRFVSKFHDTPEISFSTE